jgi:hypothetical protein
VGPIQSSAEYNSAIRQIENLRYFGGSPRRALFHLTLNARFSIRCASDSAFKPRLATTDLRDAM